MTFYRKLFCMLALFPGLKANRCLFQFSVFIVEDLATLVEFLRKYIKKQYYCKEPNKLLQTYNAVHILHYIYDG